MGHEPRWWPYAPEVQEALSQAAAHFRTGSGPPVVHGVRVGDKLCTFDLERMTQVGLAGEAQDECDVRVGCFAFKPGDFAYLGFWFGNVRHRDSPLSLPLVADELEALKHDAR